MKSAKLINGKVEIIEVKKPILSSTGAIIKILGCGLCGSDLVKIKHATAENEKNIILGHEVVGEIVEINSPKTNFKIGDIVALGHHYPCNDCEFCKNGSTSMCKTFKKTNIFPSGFSEYILVGEGHLENTVYKMNTGLKDDEKAFLEPLACCIRAVRRAGFDYDKDNSRFSALIVGLGSIGLLMAKALKSFKVDTFGIDISEERTKIALEHGFCYDKNKKYDVVFLTAGAKGAIKTALENVIDGGKIIVFSSINDDDFGFSNNEIYYRELSIISSYSPHPKDLKLSSELLNNKMVDVKNLSTIYSLDKLPQAIDDSFKNKIFKAYIRI